MKILFLTNFYPPHDIGGYGMLCLETVEGLAQRGHAVTVLTSTYRVGTECREGYVYRLLALESDLHFYRPKAALGYPWLRERNLQHLRRLVDEVRPDIVFVWGMWNLSRSLAEEAEKLVGERVIYYLANPWPIEPNMHQVYWDLPARSVVGRVAKPLVRVPYRALLAAEWKPAHLQYEHALCCSIAQRDQLLDAGVPLRHAPVIYEGIDLRPYVEVAARRQSDQVSDTLSLVYVGILAEHKGVHTAIEALGQLAADRRQCVRLTILGSGHPHYEAYLHSLVETHNLGEIVEFCSPIPRSELPQFLGRFSVLLLPSIWSEPLARIMQEGMAAGLVVVGSATGGTRETIVDGENGLLFAAEDASGLSKQIERLMESPEFRLRLAREGQQTAVERFNIVRMIDEIEDYLERVAAPQVFSTPGVGVRVSVVIPTYNHGRWVGEAIESVLNQDYRDFEVIVVDDGSTDNTAEVVSAYGDQVRYIRQENQGLSAARNTGIRAAEGAYIGVLDADDRYEPDFLSTLVPMLDADHEAGAVYCGYRFVDEDNKPLPQVEARSIAPRDLYSALLDGNFLVPESILVRRACYEAVGLFDETLRACEDWDRWLRITREFRVIHTGRILTRHRILAGSMSTDPLRMLTSRLMVLQKCVGDEPAEYGDAAYTSRRAYGRAYLGSTVEYLQCGDDEGAFASFRKMAAICPELLDEYETFYQLGLGGQPKGSLGDFASLDLGQNQARLLDLLDRLFAQSPLAPQVATYQRRAYAHACFALGQLSYGARQMSDARGFLIRAITYSPGYIRNRQVAVTLAKSYAGGTGIEQLRSVRRLLTVSGRSG